MSILNEIAPESMKANRSIEEITKNMKVFSAINPKRNTPTVKRNNAIVMLIAHPIALFFLIIIIYLLKKNLSSYHPPPTCKSEKSSKSYKSINSFLKPDHRYQSIDKIEVKNPSKSPVDTANYKKCICTPSQN